MSPQGWLVSSLLVASALVAMLRQRDAWPFSHYPMFSRRITAENLVVFRIAIEDAGGRIAWWRPRFFRMADRLCARLEELARDAPNAPPDSPALLELFAHTERLILADNPVSKSCRAVLFIRRRIERRDGVFTPRDEVVARLPFPNGPSADPPAVGLG
jgi:hypothetical protein